MQGDLKEVKIAVAGSTRSVQPSNAQNLTNVRNFDDEGTVYNNNVYNITHGLEISSHVVYKFTPFVTILPQ